jgi:hypothetical protein
MLAIATLRFTVCFATAYRGFDKRNWPISEMKKRTGIESIGYKKTGS